jgi:ferritin-like metal-binding protein YciE
MDASPDVLAGAVRAQRVAIDNDLELLRVRLQKADPRRRVDAAQWARKAAPAAAAVGALWLWARRRRGIRSLEQLLVRVLSDLYAAEQQILPVLDRMSARASNAELQRAFEQHRYETEGHLERLDRVFRSIGARPRSASSDGLAAIVAADDRVVTAASDDDVRDAALIAAAQRVEHVEIATYGTARAYAETLGFTHAAQLLQHTLEEERAADEKLTRLAQRFVNPESIRSARSGRV